ncbi:Stf0 family sulfotransferase [Luteibacter sp.]|uniref:Stf0 family sulfotransferase n=1 Tax=Luteibacter sp. TaxID=1886636 RepID=UPI003F809C6B
MVVPAEHLRDGKPHLATQYYEAHMDFNCFGEPPKTSYMLATVPRSGSTYCAVRLWQSGAMGAPMEYLNYRVIGNLLRRLGYSLELEAKSLQGYWRDVQRLRTGNNGVFGFKMFIANYVEIAKRAPAFLENIRPGHVIYLTRRDAVGQALSYSRAQRSKIWFGGVANAPEVEYDFAHVKMCLRSINHQKNAWEKTFAVTGVEPLRVTYEDWLDDGAATIGFLTAKLGLSFDAAAQIPVPMIERQTDGISREWRDRFLEDLHRESSELAVNE